MSRMTNTDADLLLWWVQGRHSENDEGRVSSNLSADRVVLLEKLGPTEYDLGDQIANWWNPEVLFIEKPEHPAAKRLMRLVNLPVGDVSVVIKTEDEA